MGYINDISYLNDVIFVKNKRTPEQLNKNRNKFLTKDELILFLSKLKDIKALDNARAKEVLSKYKDVDSTPAWAIGYISALVEKGIVSGANNKINANDTLTREQLSTIFANIID